MKLMKIPNSSFFGMKLLINIIELNLDANMKMIQKHVKIKI